MRSEVAQSCLTLCNPMDCSPPGSSVHGIFQARTLEWVAISFSRRSSRPRDWTRISCVSCIGRKILYHWATWEAHNNMDRFCKHYTEENKPDTKSTCSFGPIYIKFSEKAMAPHSSTLAWKIPWTEEPARLQSMGSLWVGHDWVTSLSLFTFMHWRRKWQPTPVFLPGESQGWGRDRKSTRLNSSHAT